MDETPDEKYDSYVRKIGTLNAQILRGIGDDRAVHYGEHSDEDDAETGANNGDTAGSEGVPNNNGEERDGVSGSDVDAQLATATRELERTRKHTDYVLSNMHLPSTKDVRPLLLSMLNVFVDTARHVGVQESHIDAVFANLARVADGADAEGARRLLFPHDIARDQKDIASNLLTVQSQYLAARKAAGKLARRARLPHPDRQIWSIKIAYPHTLSMGNGGSARGIEMATNNARDEEEDGAHDPGPEPQPETGERDENADHTAAAKTADSTAGSTVATTATTAIPPSVQADSNSATDEHGPMEGLESTPQDQATTFSSGSEIGDSKNEEGPHAPKKKKSDREDSKDEKKSKKTDKRKELYHDGLCGGLRSKKKRE